MHWTPSSTGHHMPQIDSCQLAYRHNPKVSPSTSECTCCSHSDQIIAVALAPNTPSTITAGQQPPAHASCSSLCSLNILNTVACALLAPILLVNKLASLQWWDARWSWAHFFVSLGVDVGNIANAPGPHHLQQHRQVTEPCEQHGHNNHFNGLAQEKLQLPARD